MAKIRDEDQVALARRLMALGCPLDLQFFQQAENGSSRSLQIRQVGGVIESRVFDIESGGTGYMLNLEIVSNLGRTIYIRGFELELPWKDDLFDWLPDPRERDEKPELYRFAGEQLEFTRDDVINRYIKRMSKFRNGDLLAGLVLGQGPTGIPDCHKHGDEMSVKFSVIDQFDNRHTANVVIYVDRSARLGPRRPRKPRRKLFDPSQPDIEGASLVVPGDLSNSSEEQFQASRTRNLQSVGSSVVGSGK